MTNRGLIVDWALAVFCVAMLALMWIFNESETIPYHFLFLAVAMVYGFRVWPMRKTVIVAVAITAATGALFARALFAGYISIDETSEILLMPLLLMAMVWHARRREEALRTVARMASVNEELLVRQNEFLRETSHAIRTPVTIARGYVDLAKAESTDEEITDHLEVISRQLDRTEKLSSRLLSLAALDANGITHFDMIDLSEITRRVGADWAVDTDRQWILDVGSPLWILGDVTSIEAALDALVENAIHFTGSGATIRISCRKLEGSALIEVADSGAGIDAEDLPYVFDRFWHRTSPSGCVGSGLGLSMVWAIASAHGGSVVAGIADEGGAAVSMDFPRPTAPRTTTMSPKVARPAVAPSFSRQAIATNGSMSD